MRILILAAMDKEVALLLHMLQDPRETDVDGVSVWEGSLHGHYLMVAKCGIGKVNAALNAYGIIEAVSPDVVINSGVAGGVDGSLGIGSVLVADKVAYHDVWCGPGTEYGAADGFGKYFIPDQHIVEKARAIFSNDCSVNYGLICSGDKFIHLADEVKEIKEKFPEALAVDMESAAIAQTCSKLKIPFAILRVMSDTPGSGENIEQYKNFWGEAPKKTFACLDALISNLN